MGRERRRRAARGGPEPSRAGPAPERGGVWVRVRRLACASGWANRGPGLGAGAAWEGSGSAAGARRTHSGSRAPTRSPLGLGKRCAQRVRRGACPCGRCLRRSAGNGGQRRANHIRGADRVPRATAALTGPPAARAGLAWLNRKIHEMARFEAVRTGHLMESGFFGSWHAREWRDNGETARFPPTRKRASRDRESGARSPPHAPRPLALGHRAPGPRARLFTVRRARSARPARRRVSR